MKDKKPEPGKYSVAEYANRVGCSRQAVLGKIGRKTLPSGVFAEKVGRAYIIQVLY